MASRTPMEDRYGNKDRILKGNQRDSNTVSSHLRNRDSILDNKDQEMSDFSIKPSRQIGGSSAL